MCWQIVVLQTATFSIVPVVVSASLDVLDDRFFHLHAYVQGYVAYLMWRAPVAVTSAWRHGKDAKASQVFQVIFVSWSVANRRCGSRWWNILFGVISGCCCSLLGCSRRTVVRVESWWCWRGVLPAWYVSIYVVHDSRQPRAGKHGGIWRSNC